MRSNFRVSLFAVFTGLGTALVMFITACAQAQAVDVSNSPTSTQTPSTCEHARARYSTTLKYFPLKPSDFTNPNLPPTSDLMPAVVFHLHYKDKSDKQLPSLDEIGCIVDERLKKFIAEHQNDMPKQFKVFPGYIGIALMKPLAKQLTKPDANWDSKRGLPKHGVLGPVLNDELKKVVQTSPVAKVFEDYGYKLTLTNIAGGIDIKSVKSLGGAKVPVWIKEIHMMATKTTK